MNGRKIVFLIISILILSLDIALGFLLNVYGTAIGPEDVRVLYILSKCIAVTAFFLIVGIYFVKKDPANYVIQFLATVALQFVPLAIRYLSLLSSGFLWSLLLLFAALLLYCGLIGGMQILSAKTAKAAKELEGDTGKARDAQEVT